MAHGVTPVRRGQVNEDEDFESVVQKMMAQDFDDWPNEAGVRLHPNRLSRGRGLIQIHSSKG